MDKYTIGAALGSGQWGVVRKATRKEDNLQVARADRADRLPTECASSLLDFIRQALLVVTKGRQRIPRRRLEHR